MKQIEKRLNKLEAINTPENKIQIERIIIDNKDQIQHRNKYRKVLISEDETRKIFELKI